MRRWLVKEAVMIWQKFRRIRIYVLRTGIGHPFLGAVSRIECKHKYKEAWRRENFKERRDTGISIVRDES